MCESTDEACKTLANEYLTMSIAGENASIKENGNRPGTFKVNLFDKFYTIDDETLKTNPVIRATANRGEGITTPDNPTRLQQLPVHLQLLRFK